MGASIADVRASMGTIREVRWLLPAAVAVELVSSALTWLGGTPLAPALFLAPVWWLLWLGWWGTERVVLLLLPAALPSVIAVMAWGSASWSTRGSCRRRCPRSTPMYWFPR